MAGIMSPSVQNLVVGKGFAIFRPVGAVNFTHLGNCPKLVYSPKVTVLPHFSEMQGTKVQDFSAITQLGGELSIDMEEMTAFNLSLFFLGNTNYSNPAAPAINIYSQDAQIAGEFQFWATNNVGPRWMFDLPNVLVHPTGQWSPISDGYQAMTVTMDHVVSDNGIWGTITQLPAVGTVVPENVLPPFITGPTNVGDTPAAFAQVGEVMTANIGAWIIGYGTGVTYQWNSNGTPIGGATNKTYTPVNGDISHTLTVTVTITNNVGSATATSAATMPVHS